MSFSTNWRKASEPATLAAKLGFQDADLKTPEHDEMMLWLDDRLRTDTDFPIDLVRWEQPKDWTSEEIAERQAQAMRIVGENRDRLVHRLMRVAETGDGAGYVADAAQRSLQSLAEYETPSPQPILPPTVETIIWEKPVGDSRWIAGFIDLFAEIENITERSAFFEEIQIDAEAWLGLPRFYVQYRAAEQFAFEVKTRIPSLGDLVRQIRFYQEKWIGRDRPTFYIVSGDARFAAPLQSQGIGFVEYPSGAITHPSDGVA